jgi:hypothetical protein
LLDRPAAKSDVTEVKACGLTWLTVFLGGHMRNWSVSTEIGESSMLNNLTTSVCLMLTLCACSGGASITRKDCIGGRVQLTGAYMPAMAAARMLTVEHCNGHAQITELDRALEFSCSGAIRTLR